MGETANKWTHLLLGNAHSQGRCRQPCQLTLARPRYSAAFITHRRISHDRNRRVARRAQVVSRSKDGLSMSSTNGVPLVKSSVILSGGIEALLVAKFLPFARASPTLTWKSGFQMGSLRLSTCLSHITSFGEPLAGSRETQTCEHVLRRRFARFGFA